MKAQCVNCQKIINLPDEKLVPETDVAFVCPYCKHKNSIHVPAGPVPVVDRPSVVAPAVAGTSLPTAAPSAPKSPTFSHGPAAETADDEEDSASSSFYEEGAKPALICFDPGPMMSKMAKVAAGLGFIPVEPPSVRDAIRQIRVTLFSMILLDENYGGKTRETNDVLKLVQPMEMPLRRRIFVALFGKNFQSMDHMAAYALSVNLVVNLADENQVHKILKRGLSENERFYRVYFDVMREMGKI